MLHDRSSSRVCVCLSVCPSACVCVCVRAGVDTFAAFRSERTSVRGGDDCDCSDGGRRRGRATRSSFPLSHHCVPSDAVPSIHQGFSVGFIK